MARGRVRQPFSLPEHLTYVRHTMNGSSRDVRCDMVKIASPGSEREYEVYDVGGRPLGRVMDPAGPPRLGAGAATVLLHRPMAESRSHG